MLPGLLLYAGTEHRKHIIIYIAVEKKKGKFVVEREARIKKVGYRNGKCEKKFIGKQEQEQKKVHPS
jgi:hypothetical protein